MLQTIRKLLGLKPAINYKLLVQQQAIIIDVRSKTEFNGGHIDGAINIPVDKIKTTIDTLKNKNQIIITCCASGIRSASAKAILLANGYTKVYNGGGWRKLQSNIS
jgi:phage shock protein E